MTTLVSVVYCDTQGPATAVPQLRRGDPDDGESVTVPVPTLLTVSVRANFAITDFDPLMARGQLPEVFVHAPAQPRNMYPVLGVGLGSWIDGKRGKK